jgi:hypothetical protein
MWKEISSNEDINSFMEAHYGFHDSCLKELKYISGSYANRKGMHPVNDLRILNVIFQGRFKDTDVIEIQFIGLNYLKLYPSDDNYTSEIHDATMILKDNYIFWCDCGSLSEDDLETYKGTTICASRVRWRAADEYIGSGEVYVSI